MSAHPVPVIDVDVASRSTAPAHLIKAVKAATEEIGVIQAVNHGVPQTLLDEFNRRIGRLKLERFNVGQFDNVAHARASGLAEEYVGLYERENVWPADDPRLQAVTHQYLKAARGVADRVLRVYARAQGLPPGTFALGDLPHVGLTVDDYPAWVDPDTGKDKPPLLEHANGSAVTVLTQAGGYEGLQVQRADGEWISVPVIPGALLVFSGTILTRWTNGRLRPARYRIVAGGAVPRRSTGVFAYPALGTVLRPLAPFTEPGEYGGYEPVTTWDLVKDGVANHPKVPGRPVARRGDSGRALLQVAAQG
jgi:isopenicillin N synthase-like dioxygenase